MEYSTFTTIIGVIGATIILCLFILNQFNKINNKSVVYDFLNFLGSFLLIIYAFLLGSIPFFVLNSIWAVVSLKDVLVYLKNKL